MGMTERALLCKVRGKARINTPKGQQKIYFRLSGNRQENKNVVKFIKIVRAGDGEK